MKIEAAKNNPFDKKDSKNVFKTETSAFTSSNPQKNFESVPAPNKNAFAKILEETRRHDEKDNAPNAKSGAADTDSKTSKSENNETTNRPADEKKELKDRNRKNGEGDARQNGDENQTSNGALGALPFQNEMVSNSAAPAARSILHIADLERIVSTIRTANFQNQKQVTIALNNSILQGLQIKLTLTENGRVKAEFLALNEQIKKQLKQRKKELSEILGNRSGLFSAIEIKSLQD
jgi:hypothetical protein